MSCERHTTGFSYGSLASVADNAHTTLGRMPGPFKRQGESVETITRKRRLLFAGAVQRTKNEQLTRRVMFGTVVGRENAGPGRSRNNRAQSLSDDFKVFRATEGSTERSPLLSGGETALWPTAAKKGGKWVLGGR